MREDFPITIFHNPDCGTSRNVVAIVAAAGYHAQIIHYLDIGWTRDHLTQLFSGAGLTPRNALRETKSPAHELGLLGDSVSEHTVLKAMLVHPVLVNRPFVVTPKGVRLCRPSEVVLDLLDALPQGPVYKEDGQLLIDENGVRVA
jgi:arsenate reductase (glutaredoxin)